MKLTTKTTTQPLHSAHFTEAHLYRSFLYYDSVHLLGKFDLICWLRLLLKLFPLSAMAFSHTDMPIFQAVMCCYQYRLFSVASGGSDDAQVELKEYLAAPTVSITANDVSVGKLLLLSSWLLHQLNHGKLIHLPCKVSRHSESMQSRILIFYLRQVLNVNLEAHT